MITTLPPAPARSDTPANFVAKADAFLAALQTFVSEANAQAAALTLNSTTDTSATSNTIGTGAKTFTVSSGKSFQPGMYLAIADTAAPSTNSMLAQVTSYAGTSLVLNVISTSGSGTKTAWTISQSALIGPGDGDKGDISVASGVWSIDPDAVLAKHLGDSALGFAMINGTLTASVAANALTVAVKTRAGTDPSATDPVLIVFRNATLTNGTYSVVSITAATSLVVSSGSTLGTVNAQAARLVVLLINNAGTAELAINNLSGGVNLDESSLISTTAEGGAGAADSANVVYSTTARASVPFRVVGFIDITQATAGTWATAPSALQLVGGQALAALSSLGYGQTWQSVTGIRAFGTTYYNITGKPIEVKVLATSTATGQVNLSPTVGGVSLGTESASTPGTGFIANTHFIVPPGASYSVVTTGSSGTPTLANWLELR